MNKEDRSNTNHPETTNDYTYQECVGDKSEKLRTNRKEEVLA